MSSSWISGKINSQVQTTDQWQRAGVNKQSKSRMNVSGYRGEPKALQQKIDATVKEVITHSSPDKTLISHHATPSPPTTPGDKNADDKMHNLPPLPKQLPPAELASKQEVIRLPPPPRPRAPLPSSSKTTTLNKASLPPTPAASQTQGSNSIQKTPEGNKLNQGLHSRYTQIKDQLHQILTNKNEGQVDLGSGYIAEKSDGGGFIIKDTKSDDRGLLVSNKSAERTPEFLLNEKQISALEKFVKNEAAKSSTSSTTNKSSVSSTPMSLRSQGNNSIQKTPEGNKLNQGLHSRYTEIKDQLHKILKDKDAGQVDLGSGYIAEKSDGGGFIIRDTNSDDRGLLVSNKSAERTSEFLLNEKQVSVLEKYVKDEGAKSSASSTTDKPSVSSTPAASPPQAKDSIQQTREDYNVTKGLSTRYGQVKGQLYNLLNNKNKEKVILGSGYIAEKNGQGGFIIRPINTKSNDPIIVIDNNPTRTHGLVLNEKLISTLESYVKDEENFLAKSSTSSTPSSAKGASSLSSSQANVSLKEKNGLQYLTQDPLLKKAGNYVPIPNTDFVMGKVSGGFVVQNREEWNKGEKTGLYISNDSIGNEKIVLKGSKAELDALKSYIGNRETIEQAKSMYTFKGYGVPGINLTQNAASHKIFNAMQSRMNLKKNVFVDGVGQVKNCHTWQQSPSLDAEVPKEFKNPAVRLPNGVTADKYKEMRQTVQQGVISGEVIEPDKSQEIALSLGGLTIEATLPFKAGALLKDGGGDVDVHCIYQSGINFAGIGGGGMPVTNFEEAVKKIPDFANKNATAALASAITNNSSVLVFNIGIGAGFFAGNYSKDVKQANVDAICNAVSKAKEDNSINTPRIVVPDIEFTDAQRSQLENAGIEIVKADKDAVTALYARKGSKVSQTIAADPMSMLGIHGPGLWWETAGSASDEERSAFLTPCYALGHVPIDVHEARGKEPTKIAAISEFMVG